MPSTRPTRAASSPPQKKSEPPPRRKGRLKRGRGNNSVQRPKLNTPQRGSSSPRTSGTMYIRGYTQRIGHEGGKKIRSHRLGGREMGQQSRGAPARRLGETAGRGGRRHPHRRECGGWAANADCRKACAGQRGGAAHARVSAASEADEAGDRGVAASR